jgi:hypothetical protein
MFQKIKNVSGSIVLDDSDHQSLLLCSGDTAIELPPCNRCVGNQYFFIPLGEAKVTLSAPDQQTGIDNGQESSEELEVSGQRIYGIFAADRWIVA